MTIRIFELVADHSQELSFMLSSGRPEYGKFFHPFSYAAADLSQRLSAVDRDRYWGIRCGESLAGFFMLRGWDEGFERPAFGVYIAEEYSKKGLFKLALQYAVSWCRLNGLKAIMTKVYPDNSRAAHVYEQAGFLFAGTCSDTGQRVLEKRLD
jgi:RimJ/RimL family protein N-acetyltransferase